MEPLAALVDKLPAQDPAGAEPIIKALIQGGPAVIAQLIGQVGEQFGDPAGVKATYWGFGQNTLLQKVGPIS
jgi:hypothetical protein